MVSNQLALPVYYFRSFMIVDVKNMITGCNITKTLLVRVLDCEDGLVLTRNGLEPMCIDCLYFRSFMIVDAKNNMITGRQITKTLLVNVQEYEGGLVLTRDGLEPIRIDYKNIALDETNRIETRWGLMLGFLFID